MLSPHLQAEHPSGVRLYEKTSMEPHQALEIIRQNLSDTQILARTTIQFPQDWIPSAKVLNILWEYGLSSFVGANFTTMDDNDFNQLNFQQMNFTGTTLTFNQAKTVLTHGVKPNQRREITLVLPQAQTKKGSGDTITYTSSNQEENQIFEKLCFTADSYKWPLDTKLTVEKEKVQVKIDAAIANAMRRPLDKVVGEIEEARKKLPEQPSIPLEAASTAPKEQDNNIVSHTQSTSKKPRHWSWLKTTLAVIGVVAAVVSIVGIIPLAISLAIYGCVKLYRSHASKKIAPIKTAAAPSLRTPSGQITSSSASVADTLKAAGAPLGQVVNPTIPTSPENRRDGVSPKPEERPLTRVGHSQETVDDDLPFLGRSPDRPDVPLDEQISPRSAVHAP